MEGWSPLSYTSVLQIQMNTTVNDIIAATLDSEKDLKLHGNKYESTSCREISEEEMYDEAGASLGDLGGSAKAQTVRRSLADRVGAQRMFQPVRVTSELKC